LCSWARHLTLTVPLSTQVYKWVPVNCWGKPNKLRGNDLRWPSILSRGSRNTPSRFMLQKPGITSGSYGPLGSKGFIFSLILGPHPHYSGKSWKLGFTFTVRPTVHNNPSPKRGFSKTLFKPEKFKNAGFAPLCRRNTFWKRRFSKRWRHDNLVIFQPEFSLRRLATLSTTFLTAILWRMNSATV